MTVDELIRRALASIATDAGHPLAIQWANKRLNQLASKSPLRSFKRHGELVVPTVISTGTVAVTRNDRVVTGNAAAATAWRGVDLAGRFFRQDDHLYEIVEQADTILRLVTPFTEATVTAGAYEILPRFLKVDKTARWLSTFSHDNAPIVNVSFELLDELVWGRERTSARPSIWAEAPPAPDGTKRVEVYPYPSTEAVVVRYVYWPKDVRLTGSDELPPAIPEHVLEEGILIDLYRYEMSKSIRSGDANGAGFWRNEARSQETTWNRSMQDAARADRAIDDVELRIGRTNGVRPFEIRNARDEVLARLGN